MRQSPLGLQRKKLTNKGDVYSIDRPFEETRAACALVMLFVSELRQYKKVHGFIPFVLLRTDGDGG